jgi:hypothetical protein
MNFAQMLMNGPKIGPKPIENPYIHEPDQEAMDKYKRLSENGLIHSRMVAKKSRILVKSAGKQLLKYYRAGLLDKVGELNPGEYNSPVIYRWI